MAVHIIRKGVDKRFVDVLVYVNSDITDICTEKNTDRQKWRKSFVDSRYILHLPACYSALAGTDVAAVIAGALDTAGISSIAIPAEILSPHSLRQACGIVTSAFDDLLVYIIADAHSLISESRFDNISEYISEKYILPRAEEIHVPNRKSIPARFNRFEDFETTEDDYLQDVISILKRNSVKDARRETAQKLRLDEYVSIKADGFSETLLQLIEEKGIDPVKCYKGANVNRRTFSKIRTDPTYHPGKRTVFAFAISLKLSYEETEYLLNSAGYTFTRSSKLDIIVEYHILNGIYDIFEINNALYEFDQPLLGV